jgi:glucose/arabinose dehydrogenase
MTDHSLPGVQLNAKWRSGFPTVAPSGAGWVSGVRWGGFDGMLAVGVLKAERLMFLRFDDTGTFMFSRIPAVTQAYGRLRSVTPMASGDLLVTTSNGHGTDMVLRVSPR